MFNFTKIAFQGYLSGDISDILRADTFKKTQTSTMTQFIQFYFIFLASNLIRTRRITQEPGNRLPGVISCYISLITCSFN